METIQNCQHSIRKYEAFNLSVINTKVMALDDQSIKLKQNDDFLIVDVLGIVLEETIFHPQGGGQPSDVGFINEIPVVSVRENKQIKSSDSYPIIYHFVDKVFLDENHITINIDQTVKCTLNTDIRFAHARAHSAGHLIADIIELNQKFSYLSAKAVRGHHFPHEAYIKILINSDIQNRDAFIQSLNECLVKEIKNDWPVSSDYFDNIRHIKIGNSTRKCGGTHVLSTSQIKKCIVNKIKISKSFSEYDAIALFELTIFYAC